MAMTPGVIDNFDSIARQLDNPGSPSPEHLDLNALRLLHHYSTSSYATLDRITSQHHIWQHFMVQLGFEHKYVLRGILAIAALHIAAVDRTSIAGMLIQASTQYNRGLRDFRTELRAMSTKNSIPIVAFSCFTVINAFAAGQVTVLQKPISDLLNCLGLIRGVGSVMRPYWYSLLQSELRPILDNGWMCGVSGEVPELLRLKSLIQSVITFTNPHMATKYNAAVEKLHEVILEIQSAVEHRSTLALLFIWPTELSEEFMSCLVEQEPVSLIILAHFAAILSYARDIWWVKGWDEYIISNVDECLPPDLRTWLDWPKQISQAANQDGSPLGA
ncbi:uncharacterized protein BP5553_02984 [Venustampulla echinocandica]|uniref:Uncharacterized protein n=1 Tax=Venustampulla echinocandica TaxID=2656787 RepID=A0A370TT27_9HELO|nr:uncharacterized protein BP5553_02984 [Venustampulla echinocandica]RDL38644.1 hypothetical protein BP5553_02984 [Venustampulla echinocandica]